MVAFQSVKWMSREDILWKCIPRVIILTDVPEEYVSCFQSLVSIQIISLPETEKS